MLCTPVMKVRNPSTTQPTHSAAGKFKGEVENSASDNLGKLNCRWYRLAWLSRSLYEGDNLWVWSSRFFRFLRLVETSFDCARLSATCHSLVASGSLQPITRANKRMLFGLIPLWLFWNQFCTVRKSIPAPAGSTCKMASARLLAVHGPSGIPSLSTGRPAPAEAICRNKSLKFRPS